MQLASGQATRRDREQMRSSDQSITKGARFH
jgi:hypothetical protein